MINGNMSDDDLKYLRRRVQSLEDKLAEQQEQIEEARRIKGQFLSTMSHEMRTPLNSINSLSRVLSMKAGGRLTPEEKDYLAIITRNGERLLDLINDILDLQKIESGRTELRFRSLRPGRILLDIIESHEVQAAEKGIALELRLPEDLPDIESDELRMYQIFQNLIGNAVKFTEKGGVTVTASWNASNLRVRVEDTGIGINPREIPVIFDDFKQIDSTKSRRYEGTGLGLAIARKSARILGGDINLSSTPGRGSIFTVELPLRQGVTEGACSAAAPDDEKPLILIIDDDSDSIVSLTAVLEDSARVASAADGEEGLARALELRPDLIILDMALPGISGFEVASRLRECPETAVTPVIAMTAFAFAGDRERIINAGCSDYIPKPYDIDSLLGSVKRWLKAKL